jgi:uncharacterized membrane protein
MTMFLFNDDVPENISISAMYKLVIEDMGQCLQVGGQMKGNSNEPVAQYGNRSKVIALSGVLSALVAVLTFIIIPFPPPVGGFDSSSILILSLPIILGPELGMAIVCVGEFVGTMFLLSVGGGLLYYLPGIVAVRGPEAYFVGKIARSRQFGRPEGGGITVLAVVLGPLWETVGFIAANYYLYYLLSGPEGAIVVSLLLLTTLVDLVWVPLALLVMGATRRAFGASYLDKQLGLDDDRTKRNLFRASTIFIIICWVLLVLVPFVFTSWF